MENDKLNFVSKLPFYKHQDLISSSPQISPASANSQNACKLTKNSHSAEILYPEKCKVRYLRVQKSKYLPARSEVRIPIEKLNTDSNLIAIRREGIYNKFDLLLPNMMIKM